MFFTVCVKYRGVYELIRVLLESGICMKSNEWKNM